MHTAVRISVRYELLPLKTFQIVDGKDFSIVYGVKLIAAFVVKKMKLNYLNNFFTVSREVELKSLKEVTAICWQMEGHYLF